MLARQLRAALRRSRAAAFPWGSTDPANAAVGSELGLGIADKIRPVTTTWPTTARLCSGLTKESNPDQGLRRSVPVQVGSSLKIDVTGSTAAVKVVTGGSLEEIAIRPKSAARITESSEIWNLLNLEPSESLVEVTATGRQLREGKEETEEDILTEVHAEIPSRWCGVEVAGGSGSVFVQSVREGSLRVRTQGGSVACGEVRGSEASIHSGGGDVDVRELQASAEIRTGGGRLAVNRLQGVGILVDSDGGSIALGAVYGNEVTVESRGGSITAQDLQGQKSVVISSGGGGVTINGVDGNADVVTGGGDVELQLNEFADTINVDAGAEGRVVLCLSSKVAAKLRYNGSIVQEGEILGYGEEADTFEFVGSEWASRVRAMESGWRAAESMLGGGLKPCDVHVTAAREVYAKQRSWSELVASKTLSKSTWGR